jgi:hypothetical protein
MGLFSKSARVSADDAEKLELLNNLDVAWDRSPASVVAYFLSSSPDPLSTLAEAMVLLVREEVLSTHSLAALGIDHAELAGIVKHLSGPSPEESLRREAAVSEAIAVFDSQIDEILTTAGVELNVTERAGFRSTVAQFANDNKLTDLKIAYRLMKAEGVDPLAGKPGNPDTRPGYL